MSFNHGIPHESRISCAFQLLALVGFSEVAAIGMTVAAFWLLAVGFGAAP